MKESWNSVLDLLVYTQNVQLNEILDQRYKTPALTLDNNPSWWWHIMFWHCTFCIAVQTLCETIQRYFREYNMGVNPL